MSALLVFLGVLCSLLPMNYGDSLPGVSNDDVYIDPIGGALYNRTYNSTTRDWVDPELKCGIKVNVSYEVKFTWYPPSQPNKEDEDTKFEQTVQKDPPSSTIKLTKVGVHGVGTWKCVISDSDYKHNISRTVDVSSYPQFHMKDMHRSTNLVEGHTLELVCEAWGFPYPVISWQEYAEDGSIYGAHDLNMTDPRIRLTSDNSSIFVNSKLLIEETVLEDRKYYVCVAKNYPNGVEEKAVFATLVRVKSHLAPLWPFLGILAEILVLAAIIGGYELYRRRQKTDGDDKDATQNQQPEDARKKK